MFNFRNLTQGTSMYMHRRATRITVTAVLVVGAATATAGAIGTEAAVTPAATPAL